MRTLPTITLLATTLAMMSSAIPVSADDPGVCADPCTIMASTTHYDPPVVAIENNTTVLWHSTDIGHIQRETSQPLGSPASCFVASTPGNGDSATVRFDVQNGVLDATMGTTTLTCLNAVAVDGVGFAVPYHCALHADMRGVIVVKV